MNAYTLPILIFVSFTIVGNIIFKLDVLLLYYVLIQKTSNRIGGVMANMLASSAVDSGFEHRSSQTKDYEFLLYVLLLR
jgi:hypothetical protein